MKTYIKFNLAKGESKKRCCWEIAQYLWKYFRLKEIDGKLGIENVVTTDEIRHKIGLFIDKNGWVKNSDKLNIDRYLLFIERVTRYAISKLIDPAEENTLFYPGLLNEFAVGYFIARDKGEVEMVRKGKQNLIDGFETNLKHRTLEANKHVESLKSGEVPKLGNKDVEVA